MDAFSCSFLYGCFIQSEVLIWTPTTFKPRLPVTLISRDKAAGFSDHYNYLSCDGATIRISACRLILSFSRMAANVWIFVSTNTSSEVLLGR